MKILVPISTDESSASALPEAVVRAGEDGELVLASIGEVAEVPEQAAEARAALRRRLDEVAANVDGLTITERVELAGDPVRGIVEIAREERVDEIVIASTHRGAFSRLVDGSVAEELREALDRIPVRIVAGC